MLPTIDQVQNELKRRRGSSQSWTPTGYNSSQQSSSASAPASTLPTIDQVQAELDRRRQKREQEAEKKQRERTAAAQKTAGSAIRGGASALQSNGLLQAAKLRTMTPAELNRQYDDVQKKLTELREAGRTYGVMQAGGIYTPTAETEIKKLEEERAELLRLIVDKQTTEDLSKPSDYWKRDAAQKEAALDAAKQKNQTGRNYAGMMQGGISAAEAGVEDRWNPQGVSKEQRAYDKARENYYYTMNAERWASLPEGLKNRVMEAASLSTTGLLGWKDENPDGKILDAEGKREQRRADTARLESLKGDIAAAGYDADALIEYAARMRDAKRRQKMEEDVAATASSGLAGKVAATVASYGASAVSGIGSIGVLAQRVFGSGSGIEDYRPVNINTPAQSFAHYTTAARGAVSEDMGETGEFLYGAINSAVDSAVRLLIGKAAASGFVPSGAEAEAAEQVNKLVSGLVSAQMGTQVFTNSFIEAKESGKTDDQAIVDAVVSAAIESITEKYSVEEIIRNPNGLTARALANSFGTEALEEMNSNALNTIYDELQYGDESKLRSQAQAYIDAGMDPKEAWKIVLKEYGQEVLMDGLAGGISGFAMSAANEIGNRVNGYVPSAYRNLEPEADFEGEPLETAPTPDRVMEAAPKAETDAAALEAAPAAPAAQQPTTQKADTRATPGDAVEKVTGISNYDMKVRRSDGKTVSLSDVDKRGTALEILNHTDNIEEHKDVATVNLMVASYKTALAGEQSTPDRAEMFSELFTSALYDGIAGEQKETALRGAWDSQSRLALEMAYDRGVELARGRAAAETLGPAGKEAMEAFDYTNIDMFQAFYTAGQEGLTLQKAMNAAGVTRLGKTTQEPMKAAWKAGRKDGFSYEEAESKGRYAVSDESGQRQNGMGAGGEGQTMEAGAGSRPERDSGRQRNRGAGHEGSRSSLRQLGVQSGTDAPQTVLSRTPNDYGGETITVSDPLKISGKDGTEQTVQAIQSGRNVILYADDPMLEQHRIHEEEHLRQRNMTDEEIEVLFREKTKDLTDDEVREILNAYALDYYGLYGDETSLADLYREYLADEAAGIEHKKSADETAIEKVKGNSQTKNNTDLRYAIEEIDNRIMPVVNIETNTKDYSVAEAYLKTLISEQDPFATILEDAQAVYIGKDLPGEYRGSVYTQNMGSRLRNVKMQAATNLDEMLLLATNGRWLENKKDKHKIDAKYGWYRYDAEFAVPARSRSNAKAIDHYTIYTATLLIRNDKNGKSYLYDMVDLNAKKEVPASSASTVKKRPAVFDADTSSKNSIREDAPKSKTSRYEKFSVSEPQSSAEYYQSTPEYKRGRVWKDGTNSPQERMEEKLHKFQRDLIDQMQSRPGGRAKKKDLDRISASLLQRYNVAGYTGAQFREMVQELHDTMEQYSEPIMKYAAGKEKAEEIAAKVVSETMRNRWAPAEDFAGMKDFLRQKRVYIPVGYYEQLKQYGGLEYLKKELRRYNVFLTDDAKKVRAPQTEYRDVIWKAPDAIEDLYEDLRRQFPDYFAEETNPAKMVYNMADVLGALRNAVQDPMRGKKFDAVQLLALDLQHSVYNAANDSPAERASQDWYQDQLQYLTLQYEAQIQAAKRDADKVVESVRKQQADRQAKRELTDLHERLLHVIQRLKRMAKDTPEWGYLEEVIETLNTVSVKTAETVGVGEWFGNVRTDDLIAVDYTSSGKKVVSIEKLWEFHDNLLKNDPNYIPPPAFVEWINQQRRIPVESFDKATTLDMLQRFLGWEQSLMNQNSILGDKKIEDLEAARAQMIQDVNSTEGNPGKNWLTNMVLTPEKMIARITGHIKDSPLMRLTKNLTTGEGKKIDYERRAWAPFRPFVEDKAFMQSLIGKKAKLVTIETDRGKVEIPRGMLVALYLHSKNMTNIRHIAEGGITIPQDMRKYLKTGEIGTEITVRVRRATLSDISNMLTAKEMNFAEAVQKYYNGQAKRETNAVSLALEGRELARVLNYYPIHTDTAYRKADFGAMRFDGSIEGMGSHKSRQEGAVNPIYLRDVFSDLSTSITMDAKYVGLAIPVRDFCRLMGASKVESGKDGTEHKVFTFDGAVVNAIKSKWGEGAVKYIEDFVQQLQYPAKPQETIDKAIMKIQSNYSKAIFMTNPSVAFKQVSAYPLGAAVVGYKAIGKGVTNPDHIRIDDEKIAQYTPWLWYRSQGSLANEIGDMRKGTGQPLQIPNGSDKLNATLRWIHEHRDWVNLADAACAKRLWLAAEYYVRDNQKGLKVESDAYYEAVAQVYGEIIAETQPDSAVMHRAAVLKGGTTSKLLNLYKNQSYLMFNTAYDRALAWKDSARRLKSAQLIAEENPNPESRKAVEQAEADLKKAKEHAAASWSALIVGQVFNGFLQIAYNILRGRWDPYEDEEGEVTLASALSGMLFDTAGQTAGIVPFGTEVYDIIAGVFFDKPYYGIGFVATDAIEDLANAVKNVPTPKEVKNAITGNASGRDVLLDVEQVILTASKLFGFEAENLRNVARIGMYNWLRMVTKTPLKGEELDYWYRSLTAKTTAQGRRGKDYDAIYDAALRGDAEAYRKMRESTETYIWQTDDAFRAGETTKEEAQEKAAETMAKAMEKRIRADYLADSLPEDQVRTLLTELAGAEGDEVEELIANWKAEKETGVSYDDAKEAFLSGEITGEEAEAIKTAYGGDQKTAAETVQKWQFQKDTGIAWDDMQKRYVDGTISFDQAVSYQVEYGGAREKEATKTVTAWKMEKDTGYAYEDLQDLYLNGTVSQKDATAWLQTYGGQYKKSAESKVMEWTCEKDTGINYEEIGQLYVDGGITADKARNLRVKYGGSSKEDTRKTVLKWDCEKDNGVKYDDISNAYLSGEITESKAIDWRVKYGEQDRGDAELAVQAWKWREENPEYGDLSDSHIDKYIDHAGPAGISVEMYYDARMTVRDIATIRDENGKQIKGPKEQYEEYILSMPLTQTQKSAMWYALKEKNWKDPSWV